MILIIGGAYQGKFEYAKANFKEGHQIINNFHKYVRKTMQQGKDPELEAKQLMNKAVLAGNADKLGEIFGPCILQHTADKRRAEFRKTNRPHGNPLVPHRRFQLFRRNAESVRRAEKGQRFFIIERNVKRIDARDILKHTNDFRIIVAQNIQFQHAS